MGISFYTFQTLSYTMDIYLRRSRSWDSFLDYAMYVTFFPQLVAGPIVRASEFLPQCREPKLANGAQFSWGIAMAVVGLFQKVVLADGLLAPVTEVVYDSELTVTLVSAWMGTFAFAGQIFFDFCGYSTTAIGVAMMLGFALPDNFHHPYGSIGFSDFWRRWHISLSTWLRDYLYIPLGGNRKGRVRTQINLIITMLLGGLWHGASWNFVIWGGLHGAYLTVERVLRDRLGHMKLWMHPLVRFGLMGLTFLLVCITWVFFRADGFPRAWDTCLAMIGAGPAVTGDTGIYVTTPDKLIVLGVVGLTFIYHGLMRHHNLESVANRLPWWVRSIAVAAMLVAIVTMPGEDRAFIYFQF